MQSTSSISVVSCWGVSVVLVFAFRNQTRALLDFLALTAHLETISTWQVRSASLHNAPSRCGEYCINPPPSRTAVRCAQRLWNTAKATMPSPSGTRLATSVRPAGPDPAGGALLSHAREAARSYRVLHVSGAGINEWHIGRG